MQIRKTVTAIAAGCSVLWGCAEPRLAGTYRGGETMREQVVLTGVVETVREVTVDRGQTGVGTATGAVLGGVAGNAFGHGRGSVVTTVLGAVAGGVAGQAVEGRASKVPGYEITVRLDSGAVRAIVQEAAGETFKVGERVRLLSQDATTRVTH